MTTTSTYGPGIDWNNIDMNSYETSLAIVDELSFDTLLLEIECNCPQINVDTVTKQFEEDLRLRIQSAREIFLANREAIIRKAKLVRASQ